MVTQIDADAVEAGFLRGHGHAGIKPEDLLINRAGFLRATIDRAHGIEASTQA